MDAYEITWIEPTVPNPETLDQYLVTTFIKWAGKDVRITRDGLIQIRVETQDGSAWFELDKPLQDGGRYMLVREVFFEGVETQ